MDAFERFSTILKAAASTDAASGRITPCCAAADTVTCIAHTRVETLTDFIKSNRM